MGLADLQGMKFLSTPSARRATSGLLPMRSGHPNFYPRPPRGGRRVPWALRHGWSAFLSTPSARRATGCVTGTTDLFTQFLSTPSARRATCHNGLTFLRKQHFYPRPPRGGRPTRAAATGSTEPISIHALREEGDSKNGEKHLRFCFIIKRSAQIWKSFSKNIRKKSRDLHRMP